MMLLISRWDEVNRGYLLIEVKMSKSPRLGLILSEEDAKIFWHNEENYAVTLQQKLKLKEAQRIYQSHPIKF